MGAHAYPEASRLFAMAAELARWLPDWGHAALEEAAEAASLAGEPEQAAWYTANALSLPDAASPADQARLLGRLGRYRWQAGDLKAAVDATGQAVNLLAAGPPSAAQARVLAAQATRWLLLGELDVARPLAERATGIAEQVGATAQHAHGLATLGLIRAQRGDLAGGLEALRTSSRLARRLGSAEDVLRAATNHMYLLCTAGRFADALEVAREGRGQHARCMPRPP